MMTHSPRMNSGIILWILHAVWITGSHGAQQFEVLPSPLEVNPGDPATMVCKVRDRKGECAWLKDGRVVGKIIEKYDFQREPENGDCSVLIRRAAIDEDDGRWQCQVTQTSLTEPVLTSPEVRFTVREPPMPPRIEDNTNVLPANEPYPTQSGKPKRLHCVSRKGNPAAILKWFVDDTDITSLSNQTNGTDVERSKTWTAVSVLDHVFRKEHNRKMLRCVAVHAAYETLTKEIRVPLDVMYLPEIRLEGEPVKDVEEGESVMVKCLADANPQASVIWKKSGYSSIYALKDHIEFSTVKRSDSGVYSCSASNDVGQSPELQVNIDVKFKPQIVDVSPAIGSTVAVYNSTTLICKAEGNPPPKYSWLQKMGGDPIIWQQRGNTDTLHIQNVTYHYQGQYVCEASNTINGKHYKVTSSEVSIDVTGAPQVLTEMGRTKQRVVVEKDEDAVIAVYFCSDPPPRRTVWEWGSIKLESGDSHLRFIAERLHNDEGTRDCYEARLIVRSVDGTDSRKYTLNVENDRGSEVFAVMLEVREPVAMSVVIGVVVGCIILLLIVTLVILYLLKAERMCFNRKGFKPDSSESDAESARSADLLHKNGRKGKGAIPPDALYTNKRGPHENKSLYDGLKHDKNSDPSLVYASLDLPNPVPAARNGHHNKNRHNAPPKRDRTEYAEIQFQPKPYEQASL